MVNNNKTLKTISEKQMQQRGKIRESVKKKTYKRILLDIGIQDQLESLTIKISQAFLQGGA